MVIVSQQQVRGLALMNKLKPSKQMWRAALACGALLLQTPSAFAQETAESDPRLAPMANHYARLSQAYGEEDAAMVVAYRTPDFYVELPGGVRLDYALATRALQDFFAQSGPPLEVNSDIQCASMASETEANFLIIQRIGRTVDFEGAPKRVDSTVTQNETWRRTEQGWRLAAVSGIRNPHRWVDGVEVDPFSVYDPAAAPFVPQPDAPLSCGGVTEN
jgi:hypothetical protein